ncbi:hypothetical protein HOY80DRAFT_1000821 [Tuber brumale]|nr:hypothetical protein HOY80DRAFT_1000821 [Tuber brumale]
MITATALVSSPPIIVEMHTVLTNKSSPASEAPRAYGNYARYGRLDAAGAREIQLDRIREISLLIFTSLAMMFICGTIVKTMVKIDRKIHRLLEPDVLGFEYKKARRSARGSPSYCRAIIVIIAKFLLLIAVIIYLKGILDHGIGGV